MADTFRQGPHHQTGCRQWAGGHLLISVEAAVDRLSSVEVLEGLPQLRRHYDQECLELGDRPGAAPHR